MPYYDFYCQDCRRRVTLFYKTYADYDAAVPTCPRCGGSNLARRIRRVVVAKSDDARFESLADEADLSQLENADPATMARYMRRLGEEMGEDLGDEFTEVVERLEKGESPEDIEASLPDLAGDMGAGGADLDEALAD